MTDEAPSARRSWPRRLLNRLEVDRALFYALLVRVWQFVAGPVTMLLIASFFSSDVQGYYYTFASVLAVQTFFELSLHVVILNVASHEWAFLGLDEQGRITGDDNARSRLVSLGRMVFGWYLAAGSLFTVAVGAAGIWFFGQQAGGGGVGWQLPWLVLILLTAFSLWGMPLAALLEGCDQMRVVNRYRVIQSVTGNLAVWACIPLGAGLWTAVAVAAVKLFWELFLIVPYRRYFAEFLSRPAGPGIRWREDIWPLQWRLAVDTMFGYLAASLVTPVMFHYHGPAVAGRMGMTWTALTSLQLAGDAWVLTRTPRFGMLAARRDYDELNRVFNRLLSVSLGVLLVGGGVFCSVVWLLHVIARNPLSVAGILPPELIDVLVRLSERLLPPLPTLLFTLVVVLFHVPQCQALYVCAHKRDPLLFVNVMSNSCVGLMVWWLGSRYGPTGAASGHLTVVALVTVPWCWWVWYRFRADRLQWNSKTS